MKNIIILLLLVLIFSSLENKLYKKTRKLEESDIFYENTEEIYDSISDEGNPYPSEIEIINGNSTSSDINTEVLDNKTNIDSHTEISNEVISSNIPNHTEISNEVISSNSIPNHTQISNEVISSNIPNHTEISDNIKSTIIENNSPSYSSKLILLGFGHYYRPLFQKQLIFFVVYFFRILGNIPSRYLLIPINIGYSTNLRFLEETYANCTRFTDDNKDNIQYNCSSQVDPDKAISSLNIKENGLNFGNGEKIDYIFSSYANQTKSNIISQTGSDLDKGIIVIKDTILEKDNEKFVLIGNSSEKFNDSKIILSLDNNGNIINIDCKSKNLLVNLYQFDCIPNESINVHLNAVSGKTDSGQNLIINFQDGKDDLVDIKFNSSSFNNIDYIAKASSSSGISDGAIAGIIIGGALFLIAMVVLIACCCRKKDVKPPFEESVQEPFPKDTTNQSI